MQGSIEKKDENLNDLNDFIVDTPNPGSYSGVEMHESW